MKNTFPNVFPEITGDLECRGSGNYSSDEAKEIARLKSEYVRNLSYTDSEKILLMGCSQGGFVSALVAAKNNFPIEKLVLFYPALCIPDDARAGKMMMAKFDPQNVPDTFRCGLMKLG